MRVEANHAVTAILIGLCWAIASGAAHAGSNTASQQAALQNACTEQGGRFELSWMYNDQAMQWGKVLSCSTRSGTITCRSNVCEVGHRVLPDSETASAGGPGRQDGAAPFPAEVAPFTAALATLSGK